MRVLFLVGWISRRFELGGTIHGVVGFDALGLGESAGLFMSGPREIAAAGGPKSAGPEGASEGLVSGAAAVGPKLGKGGWVGTSGPPSSWTVRGFRLGWLKWAMQSADLEATGASCSFWAMPSCWAARESGSYAAGPWLIV